MFRRKPTPPTRSAKNEILLHKAQAQQATGSAKESQAKLVFFWSRWLVMLFPFIMLGILIHLRAPQMLETYIWIVAILYILLMVVMGTVHLVEHVGVVFDRLYSRFNEGVANSPAAKAQWKVYGEEGVQQARTQGVAERKALLTQEEEFDLYAELGQDQGVEIVDAVVKTY